MSAILAAVSGNSNVAVNIGLQMLYTQPKVRGGASSRDDPTAPRARLSFHPPPGLSLSNSLSPLQSFELLLKRPEARLDGHFVKNTSASEGVTVVPELILREAMLELIEGPSEAFTTANLAELIRSKNVSYTHEQKIASDEMVKTNREWTKAVVKCVRARPFPERRAKKKAVLLRRI